MAFSVAVGGTIRATRAPINVQQPPKRRTQATPLWPRYVFSLVLLFEVSSTILNIALVTSATYSGIDKCAHIKSALLLTINCGMTIARL
jgi:hypothetical protein